MKPHRTHTISMHANVCGPRKLLHPGTAVAVSLFQGFPFQSFRGNGKISEESRTGLIVHVWKRKGDVHALGKYRGIAFLSHFLKMVERILDGRIRRIVKCEMGEQQQCFRRWRGAADGMFTLWQLVEKKLEGQDDMVLGFSDLEKAYDTVSRDMAMATLRWMGVREAEVRMVEGTYEDTKGRVVCGLEYRRNSGWTLA